MNKILLTAVSVIILLSAFQTFLLGRKVDSLEMRVSTLQNEIDILEIDVKTSNNTGVLIPPVEQTSETSNLDELEITLDDIKREQDAQIRCEKFGGTYQGNGMCIYN